MAATIVAGGLLATPGRADDLGASRAELINNLLPTVVNVSVMKTEADEPAPAMASAAVPSPKPADAEHDTIKAYVGSGFIIDPSGLIVTNFHVVDNAFEITVTLSDGTRLPAKMQSGSRLADIALLKVNAGKPLPAAHWGNSDRLHVGDQVFAAGNPFGIGQSVTGGIVSGLNRDIMDSPYDDFIQTDAMINHGNSGGPLFDMQGNVIGVDSDILSPTTGSVGLGFAIPANSAKFVVDRLRSYGWLRPGWIGIKVQQVTPKMAAAMGMREPEGSIVAWVRQDGPAGSAGVSVGDVILRFDGKALGDERALLRDIATNPAGEKLTLSVRRGAVTRDIAITAQQWPRDQWDMRDAPEMVKHPKIVIPRDLGLRLSTVDHGREQTLGVMGGQKAVMITGVLPNSDAAQQGVAAGDMILRVQGASVDTPADVQSGIDAARSEKRADVLMLIVQKTSSMPGPKWVALRLLSDQS
jgi:serine protease Do